MVFVYFMNENFIFLHFVNKMNFWDYFLYFAFEYNFKKNIKTQTNI